MTWVAPGHNTVAAVDPRTLIETFGTLGLFFIVFAESGLLVGFFLPGDSLLVTAGLLASQGVLNFPLILLGCFLAAVAGDQVGYVFGARVGPSLFSRPNSRFFRRSHVERARRYFDEQGAKTVVLARFVPIVRTFTPVLAGVGQMRYRRFVTYNVLGGFLWAIGVTTVGYTLGEAVPDIDRYIVPIVAVILVASFVPIAREVLRLRREGAEEAGPPASEELRPEPAVRRPAGPDEGA
jgi:membrane-associated protein